MKTCLVVDDSRVIRKVARRIVEGIGFACEEAGDGREALAYCRKSMPDAILLDWNMPVMNGLEFIRAVRQKHCYSDMKLLVVTSEAEVGQMVEALTAGADEYLMKPFSSEALACKLEMMGLQRAQRA